MILILLLLSSTIYLCMQIALTWAWLRPTHSPPKNHSSQQSAPPLSVIVCAHNEATNLPRLLSALFNQEYPAFEVVLVLDRCTDDTETIARTWAKQYETLTIVSISKTPDTWTSKKWALTQGVQAAQHDWLVLTDADCYMNPLWLTHIGCTVSDSHEVLIGISLYEKQPTLLNYFIRFETWYVAFQYVGWARLGIPYMAVGRNVAYKKEFFQRNRGLEAFKDQVSGDDDLLINAYAQAKYTQTFISPESRTWSSPKESWRSWFHQKTRHISASTSYSWQTKCFLALFHGCHSWIYGGILLSLLLGQINSWIWGVFVVRMGISWFLFISVNRRLKEPNFLHIFPVLDLLFFLYNLSIVPIGIIKAPSWTK